MSLRLATTSTSCLDNPLQWACKLVQARAGSGSVLGPLVQVVLDVIVVFLLVLIAGWLLRRVALAALERAGDEQVRTLTRNVTSILIWLLALAGGLVAGGFNPVWVFTFGGIFSLAIGLAFQDLLRNVLAGIFILLEKPFRIGDQVAIAGYEGVVQTISLRTTALRTDDGRLVVLPNLTVFGSAILNSTVFDRRRYSLSLAVPPWRDPATVVEAARAAVSGIAAISAEPAPTVRPHVDAEGRRLVTVGYWLDYRVHDAETVSAELLSRIWAASDGRLAAGNPRETEAPAI
jgi:small-conductance mechanosensitive channel